MNIQFSKPAIGYKDLIDSIDILRLGWLTEGQQTAKLEAYLSRLLGRNAVTVSSATAGLGLCLEYLNSLKNIDKVLTTPYTFAATVNEIERSTHNASPIFCDIDEWGNLDTKLVRECMDQEDPDIFLPVDFAGLPFEVGQFSKRDIPIIVDAAHSLGSMYEDERFVGTKGSFTVFSFHPTKTFSSIGGGAIINGDSHSDRFFRTAKVHGLTSNSFERTNHKFAQCDILYPGGNYQFNDISAKLVLNKLEILNHISGRLRKISGIMSDHMAELENFYIPRPVARKHNARRIYHEQSNSIPLLFQVHFTGGDKFKAIHWLEDQGIHCSSHFTPIHMTSYYSRKYGYKPEDFPVAKKKWEQQISLPFYIDLTIEEINYIGEKLSELDGLCSKGKF